MTTSDFFKCIETHFKNKLPFVTYRKPNQNRLSARLQSTEDLYFTKNFVEKGFVFSPFDDVEQTILIPDEVSEVFSTSYVPSSVVENVQRNKNTVIEEAKNFHINLVKKGVEAINSTDLKKVVLSRQENVDVSNSNPISFLKTF